MNRSDMDGGVIKSRTKWSGLGCAPMRTASPAVITDSTAGARTWTAAELLSGICIHDPNGAARTDVLPTAAALVALMPGVAVGDWLVCRFINGSDGAVDAENITLSAGSGMTFDANQVAAARVVRSQASRDVIFRFTNVTSGSEAIVVYM